MTTQIPTASSQIADLVAARRAANPDEKIDASFAAVLAANPELRAQYAQESFGPSPMKIPPTAIGSNLGQAGAQAVQQVGAGMPKMGQPLSEAGPDKALAAAITLWCCDHDLDSTTLAGIDAARLALRRDRPELFESYATWLAEQHGGASVES